MKGSKIRVERSSNNMSQKFVYCLTMYSIPTRPHNEHVHRYCFPKGTFLYKFKEVLFEPSISVPAGLPELGSLGKSGLDIRDHQFFVF
jgi:hypothetical protein